MLGMESSTFVNLLDSNVYPEDFFKTWECLSIILKGRTIDIVSEDRSALVCIWCTVSYAASMNIIKHTLSCRSMTYTDFILVVVKYKI